MLPIIDACSKNTLEVSTGGGKKKFSKTLSFHVDTGELAEKAGKNIQSAAEDGYAKISRFVRRKYRKMKVKKALVNMRKSLVEAVKIEIPYKILRSGMRKIVHT